MNIFYYFLQAFLLFFSVFCVSKEPHHTTAFIGCPNQIDILDAFSYYETRSFWNSNRKKRPLYSNFKQKTYSLYVEYALDFDNSLAFNGGYSMAEDSFNHCSRSIQDIELSWKHQLVGSESSSLTSQLIAIVPSGDRKASIRYGKWGFETDILYSQVFPLGYCLRGWYDLSLGYRWYEGYPSDQICTTAALGVDVDSLFWTIASCQLEYGLSRNHRDVHWNPIVLNPTYRLFSGQIECVFKLIPHIFISAGGYMHLWGENVGAGGGFFSGVWFDF